MKQKLCSLIIKGKYIVFALVAAAVVLSLLLMDGVRINYDNAAYLDSSTDTAKALKIMQSEFSDNGNIQVMLCDVTAEEAQIRADRISAIPGVAVLRFDKNDYGSFRDGNALFTILTENGDYAIETEAVANAIRAELADCTAHYAGSAIDRQTMKASITAQLPFILICCIALALVILLLSASSWLEPLIFLAVSFIGILINRGSNIVFGEISYITNSVAAILQLALSMDYSIVLLSRFNAEAETAPDRKTAMERALSACLAPIACSALTTIAGLAALVFMSFGIGADIGFVLIKGIVISALLVFTLMPGVLLLLTSAMKKTAKKPIRLGSDRLARFSARAKLPVTLAALALIAAAFFIQQNTGFVFSDSSVNPDGEAIKEVFGTSGSVAVLYPKTADSLDREREFVAEIKNRTTEGTVKNVISLSDTVEKLMTADEIANSFGIQTDKAGLLLALCAMQDGESETKMTMLEFVDNAKALLADNTENKAVTELLRAAYNLMDGSFTAEEFCNSIPSGTGIDFSRENIELLWSMYLNSEGLPANSSVKGITVVRYALSNPLLLASAGTESANALDDLARIYAVLGKDEALNSAAAHTKLAGLAKTVKSVTATAPTQTAVNAVYAAHAWRTAMNGDERASASQLLSAATELANDGMLDENIGASLDAAAKLAESARKLLDGSEYSRLLLTVALPTEGEQSFAFAETLSGLTREVFGESACAAGEIPSVYDLKKSFDGDLRLISIFTVVFILLIVLIIFKSVSIPVILVLVIQGAVWISMCCPVILGEPVFFMSYIVALCILMGATIDYGILISSGYIEHRRSHDRAESLMLAMKEAVRSVFTSGLILISCGFEVCLISSQSSIASVGLLLGRGTVVSVLMVLFVLPSMLVLFDRIIVKTTASVNGGKADLK